MTGLFGNGKGTIYKNGDGCGMVYGIVLPTLRLIMSRINSRFLMNRKLSGPAVTRDQQ